MCHHDRAATGDFHPVWFYGLAYTIAWFAWAPLLLYVQGFVKLPVPYPVALFICQTLGAFAPLISLLLIQRIKRTPDLVQRVLGRILLRGVLLRWLLLPAVVPVAIAMTTAVVHGLLFPEEGIVILRPEPADELGWALLLVIPFTFVVAMIGSPFGEEPGWRGYIFDRFAQQGRAYRGSVLVAVLWWVWHVPLFIILDVTPDGYSFLEMVGHSLLIDSFYLLSGRNLLSAMIYHQGVNIGFLFFAPKTQTNLGLGLMFCVALSVRVFAGQRLQDS